VRILTAPLAALVLAAAIAPASARSIRVPLHLMTAANVRALWGPPERVLPPVGRPPISRWVYPRFIVYFESGLVLRTVVTHPWIPPRVYPPPRGGGV
jgi:hypothetical protein